MEIPNDLSPGNTYYHLEPNSKDSPVGEDYFIESCYVFHLGEDDRRNLGKRMENVYDYVAHWDVCRGTPDEPSGFPETVIQDSYELNNVKQFLLQLEEPCRALEPVEINLSMDPAANFEGIRLHASQNIYEDDL